MASGTGSASRSATPQSTVGAVARAVGAGDLDRARHAVDAGDGRPAQARRGDREGAQPAAEIGGAAVGRELEQQLEAHPRRGVRARAEPVAAPLQDEVEHPGSGRRVPAASGSARGRRRGTHRRRSGRAARASRRGPPPRASPSSARPAAASSAARAGRATAVAEHEDRVAGLLLADAGRQQRQQRVEELLLVGGGQAEGDAPHRLGVRRRWRAGSPGRARWRRGSPARGCGPPSARARTARGACGRGGAAGRSRPGSAAAWAPAPARRPAGRGA